MSAVSSDQAAFLRTIAARPYDPAPRLVYADWCAERGLLDEELRQRLWPVLNEPEDMEARLRFADWLEVNGWPERAEYIRNGVANPRAADVRFNFETCLCEPQSDEGCEACRHLGIDVEGVGMIVPASRVKYYACRGFVELIAVPTEQFVPLAKSLFALHPIREVYLRLLRPASGREFGYPASYCVWVNDTGDPETDDRGRPGRIPTELWPFLKGNGTEVFNVYPDGDTAGQALVEAAVAFGRQRAGLKPLTVSRTPANR